MKILRGSVTFPFCSRETNVTNFFRKWHHSIFYQFCSFYTLIKKYFYGLKVVSVRHKESQFYIHNKQERIICKLEVVLLNILLISVTLELFELMFLIIWSSELEVFLYVWLFRWSNIEDESQMRYKNNDDDSWHRENVHLNIPLMIKRIVLFLLFPSE
jgi:hypothetical protein